MFRTILIGFGNIAAGYSKDRAMSKYINYSTHAKVLQDHPDFNLETVVDKDENVLKEAKNVWGVNEVVSNINNIEAPDCFEIAVIAIPPKGRLEIINNFPNLKGIILEKPIAQNINEAQEIIDLCKDRKIKVQVNFPRRCDKKILDCLNNFQTNVGNIQAAFGLYGNGIKNNGSHLIDWARMFMGEVTWVQSIANGKSFKEGPLQDDVNLPFILGFKSKNILMVQSLKFNQYRENLLDFWGEKGRLFFSQEGLISSFSRKNAHRYSENDFEIESDKPEFQLMDQSYAMYHLYSNLSDSINRNISLRSSLNNAFDVMKIIRAIQVSFDNNDERIFIDE